MSQIVCVRNNGSFSPVGEIRRSEKQKVATALKSWLEQNGEPGKEYVVIELKSPAVHIEEVVERKLVGF